MPMPRRSSADVLAGLLGGALSALLSGSVVFAASVPASLLASIPCLLATTAAPNSAIASADDKQKVPKPKPSAPPPKVKAGEKSETTDDSGTDCVDSCFGDCLMGFTTSLFDGPTPPHAVAPATAFASEASRWSVGSEAWLVAPTAMDSVGLWDAPEEPDKPGFELGRLPHGSHVVVVETHAMAAGFWTRVRPFDGVEPNGWIPSWLLTEAPAPKPAPPRPPKPDPRWGVRLLFGGAGIGPSDLDVEYSDGGVRADVQYVQLLRKQWISGFGFGYRNFFGRPKTAYQSGTTLDDPQESKLQTYEVGTRAGQRYGDRSGFRFDWMLGPTLAWVDERAKLDVYTVVAPNTLVAQGHRDDALGRMAGGGEFRANFGWYLTSGNEWGLHAGAFMFAWEGHGVHSLATDFVRSNIHGWDACLSYSFFR